MVKKTIYILVSLLIIILTFYLCGQYEKKKMNEYTEKLKSIKEEMQEEEVIKLLGKPAKEGWIETENMSKEIREKYKRVYRLIYYCPRFKILWTGTDICEDWIYLDKKGGKVIKIVFIID